MKLINKNFKKLFAVFVTSALILSSTPTSVYAAPGDLDLTFGTGGKVIKVFANLGNSKASDVIIQPDRKIVTAGTAGIAGSTSYFALTRHNQDGSPDIGFGNKGDVLTGFTNSSAAEAEALIIQPDGKLVAAGISDQSFSLARYNLDGSLDTSFGIGGKVTSGVLTYGYISGIKDLVIQSDGKLVAVGYNGLVPFILIRYNSDGTIDSSFGSGGKIILGSASGAITPHSLAIQQDGKLVAGGSKLVGSYVDFGLMRFNANGTTDTAFGNNGIVTTGFDGGDTAWDVAIQPDGKIVAGGQGDSGFALARYNENGSLDTSFGIGGKILTSFNASGLALSILPDGKLIMAGGTYSGDFALVRYNSDGTLDIGFGNSGIVITDFGSTDRAWSLAVQPDGNTVVAGSAGTSFGIARYEGGDSIINQPPTANADPDQTVNEGQQVTFNGSGSTDPDGISDIVSYEWDFGDGATVSGSLVNHTYNDNGVYTATLTVTDTAGATNTDTATITVNNVAPVVGAISASETTFILGNPTTVSTSGSFTDAGVLDTHTAVWNFGEGTTAGVVTESNGSGTVTGTFTYTIAGTYTVNLTVTDNDNALGVSQNTITINILTPSDATEDLIDLVETFNLQQGIENSLDAKLDAALNALGDINENNDQAAVNSLQAFINAVEAQRGNKITNEQANALIAAAQTIINSF